MSDAALAPAAPNGAATPAAAPAVAPAAAPVVAPVAPAAAPPAEPVKAPEPPVAAPPAEAPKAPEGSLISAAPVPEKPPAAPPAEGVVPPVVEPPAPVAPPVEAAKNFAFKPFQVPEGFVLDDGRVKDLQGLLTKFSPTEEAAQGFGQELMNLYTTEISRFQEAQRQVWSETQKSWRDEVKADPDVGGNRLETALRSCATVIEQYGGDAAEQAALREVLTATGAGNHRLMVRLFHRVGRALGEGRLVPAVKPTPPPMSRADRRYASSLPQKPAT